MTKEEFAAPIHDPAVTTPREVLVGESPVDRIAAPAQEHVPVSAEESAAIDATLDLFTLPPIRVSEAVYVELHEQAKAIGVIVQAHVRQLLEQQQAGAAEVSDATLNDFARAIERAHGVTEPGADEGAPLSTWSDIETAPKDGTNVLLVNRAGNIAAGMWLDSVLGAGWYLRGGENRPDVFFNTSQGPTHWQPLPAPPKAQQSTAEQFADAQTAAKWLRGQRGGVTPALLFIAVCAVYLSAQLLQSRF